MSSASSAALDGENLANVTAQIEEFRDGPEDEAVSQVVVPATMEGEALDQLLHAVEELREAMKSNRQYCNGLHCYTVTRPSALLPDKVMWLCEHHKLLLQQWDNKEINEQQLLDRVEDPKSAAAAATASSGAVPLSPASSPAAPPPQPSAAPTVPPSSPSSFFPSTFAPELKALSAQTVASRIKAIAPAYENYYQTLLDEGYDGKMLETFSGKADGDVIRNLTKIGVQSHHVERIVSAFKELFKPETYPIQAAAGTLVSPSVRFTHSSVARAAPSQAFVFPCFF